MFRYLCVTVLVLVLILAVLKINAPAAKLPAIPVGSSRDLLVAGHAVQTVEVAKLDFPLLRSQADWNEGVLPPALQPAQDAIAWAGHRVLVFPRWLGDMPALFKGCQLLK